MRTLFTLLCALLFAPSAFGATAGTWNNCEDGTALRNDTLMPGGTACWEPAANGDSSPILKTAANENIDIFVYADKDGDNTACTVAWTVQVCPPNTSVVGRTGTLQDVERDRACETMEGTAAVAVNNGINGAPAFTFMRFDGDAAGSEPADCLIEVKGAQPSRP